MRAMTRQVRAMTRQVRALGMPNAGNYCVIARIYGHCPQLCVIAAIMASLPAFIASLPALLTVNTRFMLYCVQNSLESEKYFPNETSQNKKSNNLFLLSVRGFHHADAGYEEAIEFAEKNDIKIPMRK